MSFWTRSGVGAVSVGEAYTTMLPKYPKAVGTTSGVLYCHGNGGTGPEVLVPAFSNLLSPVATVGYPVLSGDWGGVSAWANDTAISRVSTGRTYSQASLGAKSGKIVVTGASMGGLTALAWAAANPTLVSCAVLFLPVINVSDVVAYNRGGLAATVNAAYSGGWSEATYGATHNPITMAAAGKYSGLPILLFYGTTDAICLPAQAQSFATTVGANVTLVSVTGGHEMTTYAAMNSSTVLSFIESNGS